MMFLIFLGLVVLAVAFFHYTQGFFSAAISAILCIFAAVLSISYHEMIVEKYLGGAMSNTAHGVTVLVMFATIYLICRIIFDKMVPGNVTLPAGADKAGAGLMGVVAGFFAAGVCAFSAQSMAFQPGLMGYVRFASEEERDASIPQEGGRNVSLNMFDSLNTTEPLHLAEGDQQKLMLPVDDFLIDMIKTLSDDGALSARPLAEVHPNWLNELYGQRIGMQSSANRIAMNKADGSRTDLIAKPDEEHKDAGVYWLDRQLPRRVHEYDTIARVPGDVKVFPKADPKADPSKLTLVFRVYFGEKAKDTKDAIIRFSMGSTRLVTKKKVPGTGELEWTNYYPLGTIEEGKEFWYNRADDFLFIDDRSEDTAKDKGVDLVFQVERDGFLKTNTPDPTQAVISDGTFIEVKRMARVDLSGQPILSMSKLRPNKAIQVMRKTLVKKPPKVDDVAAAETPETIKNKIIGSWTGTMDESKFTLTADDAQLVLTEVTGGQTITKKGNWKVTGEGGDFKLEHNAVGTDGKLSQDVYSIGFNTETELALTDSQSNSRVYNRGGGGTPAPAPAPPEGATPEGTTPAPQPAPQPAPAPAAMANDTSLVVVDMYESRKFYAAVRIPDGSSGEVQVTGGTVTLEEGNIKAINLSPVTQDQLNAGTGEPLNRLAVGTGSLMMQLECTPGADGGGWAWKEKVGQIAAIDKAGNKYFPNGVWAVVEGNKVVARFNADEVVSLDDFTPTGAPSKIFFAFVIPEEQQVTKVQVGEALLKQFPTPLP